MTLSNTLRSPASVVILEYPRGTFEATASAHAKIHQDAHSSIANNFFTAPKPSKMVMTPSEKIFRTFSSVM